MKVVRVDNLNREGPGYDDKLIAEDLSSDKAIEMANNLNRGEGEYSHYYFKAVEDVYNLQVFEP